MVAGCHHELIARTIPATVTAVTIFSVGATIVHRALARLFEERGVDLERTMQLNVGGNMDFMNMLERERLESKKISKTEAARSSAPATSSVTHTGRAAATRVASRPAASAAARTDRRRWSSSANASRSIPVIPRWASAAAIRA